MIMQRNLNRDALPMSGLCQCPRHDAHTMPVCIGETRRPLT